VVSIPVLITPLDIAFPLLGMMLPLVHSCPARAIGVERQSCFCGIDILLGPAAIGHPLPSLNPVPCPDGTCFASKRGFFSGLPGLAGLRSERPIEAVMERGEAKVSSSPEGHAPAILSKPLAG